MNKIIISLSAIALVGASAPALAFDVDTSSGTATNRAAACDRAKAIGRNLHAGAGRRVTSFGQCECSDVRDKNGRVKYYECTVDVYYQRG